MGGDEEFMRQIAVPLCTIAAQQGVWDTRRKMQAALVASSRTGTDRGVWCRS